MDDMGSDDTGGGDAGMDPSLLEGQEGEFEDTMFGDGPGGKGGGSASLKVQTLLALKELGIVIAVALMVVTIFFLMIFIEKAWISMSDLYQKKVKKVEEDVEDPAALVGTFKRYK